ncbi:hypothetical protein Tco_0765447 [Tanacetum coccineum]
MITQEMPRLVNLAVNKDRDVDPIKAKEMISKEFSTHGPKMIEARLSRSGSYLGSFSALQISLEDLDSGSHEPYSIIVKFCDATLEKVLKEVNLKIFQSEPWRKPPLLGELDRDILRAFKREITKRLSHREKMRRWESFVNGRPILPMMKRL